LVSWNSRVSYIWHCSCTNVSAHLFRQLDHLKTTAIKQVLIGDIRQRFEIKNLSAADFAERLQGHVDENKKGLLSNSKSEFFGHVSKNNFKLRANKIFKSKDFGIYGEFYETNDGLTVDIEYTRSLLEKLIPIGVIMLMIYLAIRITSDNGFNIGFILFIMIFLVGFMVSSHISKANEFEKVSKTLRTIFNDKEVRETNALTK
jgi:hypothetical protein